MLKLAGHSLRLGARYLGLVLACILPLDCAAAQNFIFHLRNGDRLSGRLISEGTNSVVISTGFAEKLEIPNTLIERREEAPASVLTNQPPAVKGTNHPPLVPATGVASELTPTNRTAAAKGTNGVSAAKGPEPTLFKKFLSEWKGEVQLGANLGYGTKDREAFTGHAKFTELHKYAGTDQALHNILEYDVAYGTIDNVLSDNRMEGNIKTEFDLTKRFLIYNAIDAGYDEIRSIDLQYDFGPGVGYRWVLLTNFVFKTEFGGDYQEQFFPEHKSTSRYALRLDEDLWWQITSKIKWDEKLEFFPQLDQFGEYRLRFETNLSYLLKQNLTLSLNFVDEYDTMLPSDVKRNDLQIRSLLGIKF